VSGFDEVKAREIVLEAINKPEFLAKPGGPEIRQRYLDAVDRLDFLRKHETNYVDGVDRISTVLCVLTIVCHWILDLRGPATGFGAGFLIAFTFWLYRKWLFSRDMAQAYDDAARAAADLTEMLGLA
jgi:hypothetical protein